MKAVIPLVVVWLGLFPACADSQTPGRPANTKRLLVLTETAGFRHSSIPTAVRTVTELGRERGEWEVVAVANTASEVAEAITAARLSQVSAVVFANTTGNLSFSPEGRAAFYEWVRDGGAVVGIHSATDTFHGDADYLSLLGGEFDTHGPQVTVDVRVQDASHPAGAGLPGVFPFHDEIYEFKNWRRSDVHVILAMSSHPQTGAPGDFPLSWTKRYDSGRMFYTALGHRNDVYASPVFREHLAGGIRWALGLAAGDDSTGNPVR